MTVKQISVFVENRPGQLAELTDVLSTNGIDMRALSIADTKDFGILRLIVDEPEKTADVLRDAGWVCTVTPVLAVTMPDQPGSLEKILHVLAAAGVSLEYVYAFLSHQVNSACLVVRVEDNETAEHALTAAGIRVATQDELDQL